MLTHPNETADGFHEWAGSPVATGIELIGRNIYDDSDHGMLFVGRSARTQYSSPGIEWARFGEETEQGWGQNFQPSSAIAPGGFGLQGRSFFSPGVRPGSAHARQRCVPVHSRLEPDRGQWDRICTRHDAHAWGNGDTRAPKCPLSEPTAQRSHRCCRPKYSTGVTPSGAVEVPPFPDADCVTCSLGF